MKIFFLTMSLLFSTLSFAEPETVVYPEIYNFGRSVQVSIRNHTDRVVFCSGYIHLDSMGAREVQYLNASVLPRERFTRTIYSPNYNTRYTWVYHSIFCN